MISVMAGILCAAAIVAFALALYCLYDRQTGKTASWQTAAATNTGLVRDENQDRCYISPGARVLVVADGMGGAEGGAIASGLAVSAFEKELQLGEPPYQDETASDGWLSRILKVADDSIGQKASQDGSLQGMGTTIVALMRGDGFIRIGHMGDSRAYRLRDGKLTRLTHDHSVVQALIDAGHISEKEARVHKQAHIITRCLDGKGQQLEQQTLDLKPGDRYLLCSDGLTAVLTDLEIAKIMSSANTPAEACQALVNQTLAGGAPDNVTVCVAWH